MLALALTLSYQREICMSQEYEYGNLRSTDSRLYHSRRSADKKIVNLQLNLVQATQSDMRQGAPRHTRSFRDETMPKCTIADVIIPQKWPLNNMAKSRDGKLLLSLLFATFASIIKTAASRLQPTINNHCSIAPSPIASKASCCRCLYNVF